MAIDDNTSYELTGYQVKDLAGRIRSSRSNHHDYRHSSQVTKTGKSGKVYKSKATLRGGFCPIERSLNGY